ncbi:MAG: DUF3035 domain-containing protein [Kiloniellales bacterium]
MQPTSLLRPLVAGVIILGLGACSQIREEIGLDKTSPDEFRVVANAPLAIPPDYNLRPPAPGAPRPQEGTPTDQARVAVFGRQGRIDPNADTNKAEADRAFLSDAGANETQANIRQVVDDETQTINTNTTDFVDTLIFWKEDPPSGEIVDASGEADRIRETQALGQPITTGDTPIVIEREKGILEEIF